MAENSRNKFWKENLLKYWDIRKTFLPTLRWKYFIFYFFQQHSLLSSKLLFSFFMNVMLVSWISLEKEIWIQGGDLFLFLIQTSTRNEHGFHKHTKWSIQMLNKIISFTFPLFVGKLISLFRNFWKLLILFQFVKCECWKTFEIFPFSLSNDLFNIHKWKCIFISFSIPLRISITLKGRF